MKVKPEEQGESSCTGVSVSVNHAGQNMSEHSSDDLEKAVCKWLWGRARTCVRTQTRLVAPWQVAAGLRQQGSSSFKSFLSARAECPL